MIKGIGLDLTELERIEKMMLRSTKFVERILTVRDCELMQIEILKDEVGKPLLFFDGEQVNGFISITHTKTTAAAQVILMQ